MITDVVVRTVVFALGAIITVWTLTSAIRSFVLPRSDNVFLTRLVSQAIFRGFQFRLRWANNYEQRDRIMAFFCQYGCLEAQIIQISRNKSHFHWASFPIAGI